jgi:hypothetical protein
VVVDSCRPPPEVSPRHIKRWRCFLCGTIAAPPVTKKKAPLVCGEQRCKKEVYRTHSCMSVRS